MATLRDEVPVLVPLVLVADPEPLGPACQLTEPRREGVPGFVGVVGPMLERFPAEPDRRLERLGRAGAGDGRGVAFHDRGVAAANLECPPDKDRGLIILPNVEPLAMNHTQGEIGEPGVAVREQARICALETGGLPSTRRGLRRARRCSHSPVST